MATTEQVATMIQIMQQQNQQVAQLMVRQQEQKQQQLQQQEQQQEQQQQQQQRQQQQQQQGGSGNTKKPDRPTVNSNIDDREWALFIDTWGRYKDMIGVSTERANDAGKIRNELRECCSNDVNKMLFEFVGPTTLNNCNEATLLAHMKTISVKEVHPEVHQTSVNLMIQDPGESVTQWVARLRSMACLCKFEIAVNCNCEPPRTVSYADKMVAQRLIAGLANLDHRRKLLADASSLPTLEEKIQRLQLLETTEESAAVLHRTIAPPRPLHGNSLTEAAATQPQHMKRGESKSGKDGTSGGNSGGRPAKCKGCGNAAHPGGRSKCRAFKKTCNSCGKKGHLAAVCNSSQAAHANEVSDVESDSADEIIQSESSVSFSLGEQQDFRSRRRRNKPK